MLKQNKKNFNIILIKFKFNEIKQFYDKIYVKIFQKIVQKSIFLNTSHRYKILQIFKRIPIKRLTRFLTVGFFMITILWVEFLQWNLPII